MDKNTASAFSRNNNFQEKPSPAHVSVMMAIANTLDSNEERGSITGKSTARAFSENNNFQEKPSPAHASAMMAIANPLDSNEELKK